MKTQATEENILKYLEALKRLHIILGATNRLSMFKFSVTNNLSKNISTVLKEGGVIKCLKKGKGSEWEWTSIPPNREMAIRLLKGLANYNPPRTAYQKKEKNNSVNIIKKTLTVKKSFFWGLYKFQETKNY